MLLSKTDILAAMHLGLIRIEGATEINSTSVDICIEDLLAPAMKEEDMKSVPLNNNEYWVLPPNSFHLMRTVEKVYLAPFFHGMIHSRSSSARHGLAIRDVHEEFSNITAQPFYGQVICSINTLGTKVILRPGDSIAQTHLGYRGMAYVLDHYLKKMIRSGELKITRRGKRIKSLIQTYMIDGQPKMRARPKGQLMNGGFTLTTDPMIRVYTGRTIDHQNPDPDCFEQRRLANQGTRIKQGTFFLSSSAEHVKIPRQYVGWVAEWNHLLVTSGQHDIAGPAIHPDTRMSTRQTHAAAPKIDPYPRFEGTITFENLALTPQYVRPGQRLCEFYLMPLQNPIPKKTETSRYKGQSEATSSRSYMDNTTQQELDFE
ncbi:hypothetical protein ACFL0V_00330 [Nanoarchaeota archaeon]